MNAYQVQCKNTEFSVKSGKANTQGGRLEGIASYHSCSWSVQARATEYVLMITSKSYHEKNEFKGAEVI